MVNRLRRHLHRVRLRLTVAWSVALLMSVGLWQFEQRRGPDVAGALQRGRSRVEQALHERAQAKLPSPAGAVHTVVVLVPFEFDRGALVLHQGILVGKQNFEVGPRSDEVVAVTQAQVSAKDVAPSVRWSVVGPLACSLAAWLFLLIGAWRSYDDIFASYNRDDSAEVFSLVDGLRRQGSRVWIDRDGIQGGDEWWRKIQRQMGGSRIVVVFVGATYPGETQQREVDHALHLESGGLSRVVPVILASRSAEPPATVPDRSWVDLRGQAHADQVQLLLRAVD